MLLLLLVLSHGSQHVSAAEVGVEIGVESVLLPCLVDVLVSRGSTLVWKRSDLQPSAVHIRQPAGDYLTGQNQRFINRTSVMNNALVTGDLSLTLRSPTYADSGTYTCVVNRDRTLSQAEVLLYVKEPPPPPPVWPAYVVAALVVIIALFIGVGVFFCQIQKTKMKKSFEDQLLYTVEAEAGQDCVTLPFNLENPRDGEVVEWRHVRTDRLLYKIENCQEQLEDQHPWYKDRVKGDKNALETGDFSLTLMKPRYEDGHIYICTVYKDGKIIQQRLVELWFKGKDVKQVEVGAESVTLNFKLKHPDWDKVDWKHVWIEKLVYTFENGYKQPGDQHEDYRGRVEVNQGLLKTGDFSLTLRNLQWQDSGVYICTVYKDGEIIKQKAVNLWVSAREIKVEKGVESVRLCFKFKKLPDSSEVEWRNMWTNKLVWKFENGQEQPGDQHQDYQGRVEVTKDLLRTGDFSLTLKKPDYRDEGVYTCTVYKDKKELVKQKALHLWVIEHLTITERLYQFTEKIHPAPRQKGTAGGPNREEEVKTSLMQNIGSESV
ncbi:polymeric immunoglobulin receptor isoform X1 [Nothobranchius furzeri]|uniref:LOC107396908-like protein n=1 Tax=Nothobranchius furzeri TaxID=105023 RepID=A0A9D3C7G0_NOTFU|nr:putative LOC107396908-like protein [Nothobranchius furzeri]